MARRLTGTWEEIKAYEGDLAGRRVAVTVEDAGDDDRDIEARVAAAEVWVSKPRPSLPPLLDDSRAAIYGKEPEGG